MENGALHLLGLSVTLIANTADHRLRVLAEQGFSALRVRSLTRDEEGP